MSWWVGVLGSAWVVDGRTEEVSFLGPSLAMDRRWSGIRHQEFLSSGRLDGWTDKAGDTGSKVYFPFLLSWGWRSLGGGLLLPLYPLVRYDMVLGVGSQGSIHLRIDYLLGVHAAYINTDTVFNEFQ
jgi:hypothetical protein